MDIPTAAVYIDISIKVITVLLAAIAASLAAAKKQYIAIPVVFLGNAFAISFLLSPLAAWVFSLVCIIPLMARKGPGRNEAISKNQRVHAKNGRNKFGNIVGILLGSGFVAGPLIAYTRQEASLGDPTTQGVLILFAVVGAFMIINNFFALISNDGEGPAAPASPPKAPSPMQPSQTESTPEKKVRCRFCDKLYSAEYDGCPHCKK